MPKTRRQTVKEEARRSKEKAQEKSEEKETGIGEKRNVEIIEPTPKGDEPPTKKAKTEEEKETGKKRAYIRQTGTIERGYIYFFYRPKVQMKEAHSLDDVKNLFMLLIPRPPKFSVQAELEEQGTAGKQEENQAAETEVLASGADAVPAPPVLGDSKQHYRLLVVGKKHMPDPETGGSGRGRKETFWATVAAVGDDLHSLERGLGEKTYETKTRGTRHQEPARLAARGAYAVVNNEADVPSQRTTHFGYYISHPEKMGEVQKSLGIATARAYVMQVKNPMAPATIPGMHTKGADYPGEILRNIFGRGQRGREEYGLRFVSCEVPELLDYEGGEVILIAARGGKKGLEESLEEGRGTALEELEEKESCEDVKTIFKELDMTSGEFSAEPLEGQWI